MAEAKATVRTIDTAYHRLLDSDTRPIPESYRRDSPIEPGPTHVPVSRYISKEFHDLEVEKVWKRVWQVACHEDDIPGVGDYIPYDIAQLSFLVIRTSETEIKAYWNACLHRGRKLRENAGKGATELRCPFHGWTWNTDGSLRQVPCQWDYPGLKAENEHLQEVKVGRWGRFVFINPDLNCEPLEDFLGDLPTHFELLPYEKRYKEAHVAKIIRCNWKVASEAFMESYHVIATHPQILLGGVHDVDTKYDVFGNYSRAIRCGALESNGLPAWESLPEDGRRRVRHPLNGWVYEATDDGNVRVTTPKGESALYDVNAIPIDGTVGDVSPHLCTWVAGKNLPVNDMEKALNERRVKDDRSDPKHPRIAYAGMQREVLKGVIPSIADQIADIEFSSVFFTLFPNFHPWGSFNRIVYRFRPNGGNPEECIMECMYLAPIPEHGNYKPCSTIHWLGPDDDWTEAPELGMLAKVFQQDVRNLPYVQLGLHTLPRDYVQLADYNETKPRHLQMLLEEWVQKP
jgi:phenylpropionate dioxygenase-like ring-hydroxylating dioxygenase large terminal subunit